jgi:hypothetical protein
LPPRSQPGRRPGPHGSARHHRPPAPVRGSAGIRSRSAVTLRPSTLRPPRGFLSTVTPRLTISIA